MPAGLVPEMSPKADPTKLSYFGLSHVIASVRLSPSTGRTDPSNSTPQVDCLPALASAKPVPVKMFDWNPLIDCLNTARFSAATDHLPLSPNSSPSDSSGPAQQIGTASLRARVFQY